MRPAERFLAACRNQPVDCTPIWMMRQAGRYLPEYRSLQERYDFLTLAKTPELAATITLQPLRRFDVDAAILFADILLPLEAVGFDLRFVPQVGPVIDHPITRAEEVARVQIADPQDQLGFVLETLRLLQQELHGKQALIGFAGAPFTLASYAIEGRSSKDYRKTKCLMWEAPQAWHQLMEKLAETTLRYLRAQVAAGAQAVQLFDSWVGALSPLDYTTYVLPHSQAILDGLKETGVPVIHFAVGASGMIERLAAAGGDVIGLDWRIDIGEARQRLGRDHPVQGNLDPMTLLAPQQVIAQRCNQILQAAGPLGHVMNLGHGILPDTPVENVAFLVNTVHTLSREVPAGSSTSTQG